MIQAVVGFLCNAAWQVPLLAAGPAILLRLVRLTPAWQCRIWSAFLALALLLPANIPLTIALRADGTAVSAGPMNQRTGPAHATLPVSAAETPVYKPGIPERQGFVIERTAAEWLVLLYLAVIGISAACLLLKLARAGRLRATSCAADLPFELEQLVRAFAARHGTKPPQVRMSARVMGPVAVGLVRPTIIVPSEFGGYNHAEAAAALLHECAHVVRRDYAFNLICEILALPLLWHPLIHFLRGEINTSREMACDQLAADGIEDRAGYARSLVALASRALDCEARFALSQPLLGHATLERRVHAIVRAPLLQRQPVALKALALAIVIPASVAPGLELHLSPSIASLRPAFWRSTRMESFAPQPPQSLLTRPAIASSEPSRGAEPPTVSLPRRVVPGQVLVSQSAASDAEIPEGTSQDSSRTSAARSAYPAAVRQEVGYNGISDDELANFERAGYSNFSASELVALHYRGVSGDFVSQLSAAGFPPFTFHDLLKFADNGMSANEIAAFGPIGHSTLSADDLIRLSYRGIPRRFLDRLVGLGYANLSADRLLDFFYGAVPVSPARDLRRVN